MAQVGQTAMKRPGFRVRPLLVFWHRWFGIFATLWLALMGITGSAVVYYGELDTWLNPDLRQVEVPDASRMPAAAWLDSAQQAYPERYVRFIDLPDAAGKSVRISMPARAGGAPSIEVYVDPYSAEVLGHREHDVVSLHPRYLMNFLYELHLDLHLGPLMVWFLGLVSLLWIIDHFAAAYLSFPKLKKWMASFRVRFRQGGHKTTFDLHRAGALWVWPVTLALAVSGVYFNWYEGFVRTVDAVSPVTPRAIFTLEEVEQPVFDPAISFPEAFDIAGQGAGDPEFDMASYNPRTAAYELRAYDPRDIDGYGRRMIVIGGEDGSLISDRHSTEGSAGDVFLAWQYPLHSGKAFGAVGRAIIFVSGILLSIVCITGIMIWARKRAARRKRRS
ncbi:PepSY domain-containing protein [Henriciella sp.]|uniref:PepSY-associated TM helix domain-containing protein n=1 Tax=Henriciella sp. TaxID=1968823 RepID=UPI0026128D5B|nr:PepSY-associated TM helix domain-containing protein [Henriciella sp.]